MKQVIVALIICLLFSSCTMIPRQQTEAEKRALALVDKGIMHIRSGKLRDAEASFQVALDVAQTPEAYDGIGCVRMLQGKYDVAERYFYHAYNLDKSYSHVYTNLAMLYQLQGRVHDAATMYEYALQSDPEDFRARNNYAAFTQAYGVADKSAILEELERAHALAPHPLIADNIEQMR